MNKKLPYFIIDFDSTFVKVEGLDRLATIVLKDNPQKEKIIKEISDITKAGMEGTISFPESLNKRLKFFYPEQRHIDHLIEFLKKHITLSVERNKSFFQKFHENIFIISGGFKEYIFPVIKEFGITEDHVLANKFIYKKNGKISGFDKKNPLSKTHGKVKAVDQLKLKGQVIVLGDGITDYQIKEQGKADEFFAFVENANRKGVVAKADKTITSFDELLHHFNLPRAQSFPTSKMNVLLLENISKEAVNRFHQEGYHVKLLKASLSEKELIKEIGDTSILGIRSKTEITKNVLLSAKKLMTIGAFCIGTNQIDLGEAAKNGIAVFNAPYSNTRSVVELVFGEIIMLFRNIFDKSINMHKGKWDKSATGSFEIRGKKLGIIGYGNIGSQLSILAENAGMQVYFYDVEDKLSLGNTKKCQSLKELLSICDVITVHVDGAKTNKNLIGEKEFSEMKDGVIFLNLSRGHVVDIDALAKAIKSKKIAGCSVDVFPNEPKSNAEAFISPLQGLPNVILTPHIAGSTEEAQKNIGEFVSNKLIQYINTGNTVLSVNFPEISLPEQKDTHRIIHIHENIPGVIAQINNILSEEKVNIEGQHLKTNEQIGCVITDINKKHDDNLKNKLQRIPGTISVRILY